MWPFSLFFLSSANPSAPSAWSKISLSPGPRREYLVCSKCRNWYYLTSIEVRYFDEFDKPFPELCRVCARKEREARAALKARDVEGEALAEEKLVGNG